MKNLVLLLGLFCVPSFCMTTSLKQEEQETISVRVSLYDATTQKACRSLNIRSSTELPVDKIIEAWLKAQRMPACYSERLEVAQHIHEASEKNYLVKSQEIGKVPGASKWGILLCFAEQEASK